MDTLNFLQAFHPGRLRVLTAIGVDRKSIETRSFDPGEDAREWIKQYEGKRNLYFSVNVPRTQVGKKTKREDIALVPWLHVDVDARAGENLESELERIRKLLVEECQIALPTVVVFSGGGYQAFWRLREPIVIDGDMGAAQEAARYNRQLEVVFGGDNCFNIDRIMRLPGTMNLPDARKAAKGRLPARARVIVFESNRVYDLSQFKQAPPLQNKHTDYNIPVLPVGNLIRLSSVNELDKWQVDDRTKVIVVQGQHPDEEPKPSRSEWLFDVCCQLVRRAVPDEVIYKVITDPDFKISESVLDKGVNADRYAARQIQRAKEEVEEPRLRMLNDRFVIIGDYGGKCVVVEELERRSDTLVSHVVQARGEFCARFAHEPVQVGKRTDPLGKWWLTHPNARRRERVVFRPTGETAPNDYNLWRGFAVEPKEGDCALFLDHVRENIAPEHSEWLLNWMARAVQRPNEQAEIAIVQRGAKGVGKSFFVREFGRLFGPHYLAVSNPQHLVGHFNAHLEDCIVLLADEAFYAGDRKDASVLKALITEPTLTIERKGFDLRQVGNHLHIIMCSNDAWVVPAGLDERRFLVLDVGSKHRNDTAYFAAITEQMKNGGRAALLHFLLARDIRDWDFRRAPETRALTDQKLLSLSPVQRALYEALATGAHPRSLTKGQRVFVVTDAWSEELEVGAHALGHELRRFAGKSVREVIDGKRHRGFWLPALKDARRVWAATHGLDGLRWPDDVNEWEAAVDADLF